MTKYLPSPERIPIINWLPRFEGVGPDYRPQNPILANPSHLNETGAVNHAVTISKADHISIRQLESTASQENLKRRIIVCLDGTMETDKENTNVHRFFSSIDIDHTKVDKEEDKWEYKLAYCPGVGTHGLRPLSGALFGYGIFKKIMIAYQFICDNYRDQNDQIWLIGYSRGAFAARSLSNMIYYAGLLPFSEWESQQRERPSNKKKIQKKKVKLMKQAYQIYLNSYEINEKSERESDSFKKEQKCKDARIQFLGCFDTVGAIGLPQFPIRLGYNMLFTFQFERGDLHDTDVSPNVVNACHAMALHDRRIWFKPIPMTVFHPCCENHPKVPNLKQLWFPGMHSDIGGKYSKKKGNLISQHTLRWMMENAMKAGLKFLDEDEPEQLDISQEITNPDLEEKAQHIDIREQTEQLIIREQIEQFVSREQIVHQEETKEPVLKNKPVYKDSYKGLYKIMPPADRKVKLGTACCQCIKKQLYREGEFDSIFSKEAMDGFKSYTLTHIKRRIKAHCKHNGTCVGPYMPKSHTTDSQTITLKTLGSHNTMGGISDGSSQMTITECK